LITQRLAAAGGKNRQCCLVLKKSFDQLLLTGPKPGEAKTFLQNAVKSGSRHTEASKTAKGFSKPFAASSRVV
jgi:hypothetical protein